MDDRTIIDDGSERITDPMEAKPGDLLVLGQMDGDDFKQKIWLTVDSVEKSNYGLFLGRALVASAEKKNDIKVNGMPFKFVLSPGANRTESPIEISFLDGVNDKLRSTELYFDCLIRPYEPFKRGIYKFYGERASAYYYFDGEGSYVFLDPSGMACHPEDEKDLVKRSWSFPRSGFSLVLSLPIYNKKKDDDGKKSI